MAQHNSDTTIVGAGPSGLTLSACLKRAGAPFVPIERAQNVGPAWRTHYERFGRVAPIIIGAVDPIERGASAAILATRYKPRLDESCVADGRFVSAQVPKDLPVFMEAVLRVAERT